MIQQYFTVTRIIWTSNDEVHHNSIELCTDSGFHFTCFSDGNAHFVGQKVCIETFYWLNFEELSRQELLNNNLLREKSIVPRENEWDFIAYGQVVGFDDQGAIIDCGDLIVPYEAPPFGKEALDAWIGFHINRLEIELCAK